MPVTKDQCLEEISWANLREMSTRLGVPAWKLAEDGAFHVRPDAIVVCSVREKPQAAPKPSPV